MFPDRPVRVPHVPPDFLSSLVALANFMRLSLQKVAHANLAECSVQEIRVAPAYMGRKRCFSNAFTPRVTKVSACLPCEDINHLIDKTIN
jgi:hypothetical protein